ncbi:MAG: VTT domain-containing protein [Nitrososphaera sp.]
MVSVEDLFPFDPNLGYAGILLLSFIFSIIPFIPVPYFPILITAALNKNFDPHLIALSSAAAIVAAKTIIFFASYYGRAILSEGTKTRMRPLQRVVSRYGWPGAFIAAATPIPDDIVYIPLGLAKYSPWKFVTATFAGKLVMSEAIVWGSIIVGRPFIDSVLSDTTNTTGLVIGVVISVAILAATVYYSLRIDWARIIGRWFPWALKDEDDNGDETGKKDGGNKP